MKVFFFLLLFSLGVTGLDRLWYRVGEERNASPTEKDFQGASIDIWALFGRDGDQSEEEGKEEKEEDISKEDENGFFVFFGGVLRSKFPEILDETHYEAYANLINSKFPWLKEIRVLDARVFDIYSSFDFAVERPTPYAIEVAQLDAQRQIFENNKWLNVQIGFVSAISFVDVSSNTSYRVMFNSDRANRMSITYFSTYDRNQDINSDRPVFEDGSSNLRKSSKSEEEMIPEDLPSASLKVVSYNIWHTMPPSWVYHDSRQRRERYSRRLKFLSESVIAENPDVVVFQEVRLDSSFRLDAEDTGSQVEHLLRFLRNAEVKAELCEDDGDVYAGCTRWNVFFHPAMSMFDKRNIRTRHEEGLAIFAREKLPLIRPGVLLLPRDLSLATDDHNRAVIGARVPISRVRGGNSNDPVMTEISIMGTHFSLDASARERAVSFLLRHTEGCLYPSVLGGDLNGEPEETFFNMLVGEKDEMFPFQDTFQTALDKGTVTSAGSGRLWIRNGYTFPTCNPEKRIDFLLSRNSSGDHASLTVESFKLFGTEHGDGVGDSGVKVELETGLEGELLAEGAGDRRPDLGMLDGGSHLWASDHFGIATVLRVS